MLVGSREMEDMYGIGGGMERARSVDRRQEEIKIQRVNVVGVEEWARRRRGADVTVLRSGSGCVMGWDAPR